MEIIIVLIVLLLISHGVVLFKLKQYIDVYKANNQNYISNELEKLNVSFENGVRSVNTRVKTFQSNTNQIFTALENDTHEFTKNQENKFNDLTKFIKSDYTSLTKLLNKNNNLLDSLLARTKESITQNEELKPALLNGYDELQKVYSKIKQIVSGSEKSVKDVKEELENTLMEIKLDSESKVKQLQSLGEKNLKEISETNAETLNEVFMLTKNNLNEILSENHIQHLTTKVEVMETDVQNNFTEVLQKSAEINVLLTDFVEKIKAMDKKRNIFGF